MICNLAENYWKNEVVQMEEEEELDIYTEDGIDEYVDDDSITPSEQGFMKGYLGA
mgnify:CR=1 FL=1